MARYEPLRRIVGDLALLDSTVFADLLHSCLKSKSLRDTCRVHARIIKTQFASEVFIQNRLIDVYAKCGCLNDARMVFDRMPQRNTFSWNSILTAVTKSGFVDEAVELFNSMPGPDQCSWNSMVSGLAQHDQFEDALTFFGEMHREDFVLNEYSYSSALSSCAGLLDLRTGIQIHGSISKSAYSSDVYMGSALIDMYSKCGNVSDAQKIFDEMVTRNTVSWNSLITCYEQKGPANKALELFVRMTEFGIEPDEVTLASVVSACATLCAVKEGFQIHARVIKFDKLRDDLVLGNALVDMYAKCGRIKEARCIFDRMPCRNVVSETSMVTGYAKAMNVKDARLMFTKMTEKNVVSWNALIAGYTQNEQNEVVLELFCLLKRESIWPTHCTFGNILNACANLANLQLGKQVHGHVLKQGFQFVSRSESDVFVGNSLVNMYTKCGAIKDGCRVFGNMNERDQVSWNAMIVGYAQNGHATEALGLFKRMLECGERPDHVTMIGVLSACSHTGMVEAGRSYFTSMIQEHGLVPQKDHYTCMVDLLGRAGCLKEAKMFIEKMPLEPDTVLWASLLAACKVHGDLEMGMHVAGKLLELDSGNSGPYVLLSNMHAKLGQWGEVTKVRKLMRQRGVVKQPGCSWIEIENQVHVFMVKDKRHRQRKEIYNLLSILSMQIKRVGYVVDAEYFATEAYKERVELDLDLGSQIGMQALAVNG